MVVAEKIQGPSPQPPFELDHEHYYLLRDLYFGIRNPEDPVTWRTLVIDCRKLLGSPQPDDIPVTDKNQFVNAFLLTKILVGNTFLTPLVAELINAIGFIEEISPTQPCLPALLINGRHLPEPLLDKLAKHIMKINSDSGVAVINPVGHFSDDKTRILGPNLLRTIEHAVIMASTQDQKGGGYEVLSYVTRLLRNPDFSNRVRQLDIVIPMFGGSRGHKLGQDLLVGYEVLEAKFNAKLLGILLRDILKNLGTEGVSTLPTVVFYSVDIHNEQEPKNSFNEEGYDFINVNPGQQISEEIICLLQEKNLETLPIKLVASDNGAVGRTEQLASKLLSDLLRLGVNATLDIIYVNKDRKQAGSVNKAEIAGVVRWSLNSDHSISKVPINLSEYNTDEKCCNITLDDMLDTGGTAAIDQSLIRRLFSQIEHSIFVATHAVLSKGTDCLDKIGVDSFIFTNTLKPDSLLKRGDVRIVDVSPAIWQAIIDNQNHSIYDQV